VRHLVAFDSLAPFGWNDRWAALLAAAAEGREGGDAGLVPGRVVRHDGAGVVVALPDGARPLMLARPLDPAPAVGDWLAVAGDLPVAVLPRTSL
jgi:ribosome biogenesis GTPase / thiamine phosphate phosphatase